VLKIWLRHYFCSLILTMSAKRDWDFPVHFYYGNAAQDLSHLLPIDEVEETTLEARLSGIELLLEDLTKLQEQISFYLRDVLRVT